MTLMKTTLALFVCLLFSLPTNALYFFMKNGETKCFLEDLPKDTLVVGHYEIQKWVDANQDFITDTNVKLVITVDQVSDNHRIVNNKADTKSRFTFTAHESGEHRMCFTPVSDRVQQGHLKNGQDVGGIKISLDIAIGETSNIESTDKGKISDITSRIKDLNGRLADIRREQVFQREREAEFRDQSESTNSRVVRWTLIQLIVLGVTCAWQLSHLRAFFIKQKLT